MTEKRFELEAGLLVYEIESLQLKTEEEWQQWLDNEAMNWEKDAASTVEKLLASE